MRRWLFLFWFALLIAPAAGLLGPWERASERESRMLGQPPKLPHTRTEALALPRDTDAFVRDQFAGRELMIRINAALRRRMNDRETGAASPVVTGNDNHLLLREGLAQSVGIVSSPLEAQYNGALVCEIEARVEARGARFLYAIPPSPGEIYPEIVPDWLGVKSATTDYDLLMRAARGCGADVLDLRPMLRAQRNAFPLYRRTDTHWTDRGALIAYNAIVERVGHAEFRIRASDIAWRRQAQLGDLTRMLDASDDTREQTEAPDLRPLINLQPAERILPTPENYQDQASFIRDFPRDGLSVLVIGDSFTRRFFPLYLAPFVRRVGFMHHQRCNFDWRDLEQVDADIVLFMPTERTALCPIGARPRNFG